MKTISAIKEGNFSLAYICTLTVWKIYFFSHNLSYLIYQNKNTFRDSSFIYRVEVTFFIELVEAKNKNKMVFAQLTAT